MMMIAACAIAALPFVVVLLALALAVLLVIVLVERSCPSRGNAFRSRLSLWLSSWGNAFLCRRPTRNLHRWHGRYLVAPGLEAERLQRSAVHESPGATNALCQINSKRHPRKQNIQGCAGRCLPVGMLDEGEGFRSPDEAFQMGRVQ